MATATKEKVGNNHKQLMFHAFEVEWDYEIKKVIALLRSSGAPVALIDLFCGAGGTTTGMEQAEYQGQKLVQIILGVNHDRKAIESHLANHPDTLHLIEDVRTVNLMPIKRMVEAIRAELPYIKVIVWASAECTHISNAKGGDSRDEDSRSLSNDLLRYDKALKPDLFMIENVMEIRSWGPMMQKKVDVDWVAKCKFKHVQQHQFHGELFSPNGRHWYRADGYAFSKDKKGIVKPWMIPIPERKGEYFKLWVKGMKRGGLKYHEDMNLNAADFGARTSRRRFFAIFSRNDTPIIWPVPTHAKKPTGGLQRWLPVRDVLMLDDKGDSIFVPDRIKSEATFKRIFEGMKAHVVGGADKFDQLLQAYYSGDEQSRMKPLDLPAGVVTTNNRFALTSYDFMTKAFSGDPKGKVSGTDVPAGAVTTVDHHQLCVAEVFPFGVPCKAKPNGLGVLHPKCVNFMQQRNSGEPSAKVFSLDRPARTLTKTGGNQELVTVEEILPFMATYHGSGHNCTPVNNPSPTVAAADINSIVTPQSFVVHYYSGGGQIGSLDNPAATLTTTPKINVVNPEGFLLSHQYSNGCSGLQVPSQTVIAKQDKKPLHLVHVEYAGSAFYGIAVYTTDTPAIRELKRLMAMCNVVDIKMRMLYVKELLRIQGFPESYILKGSTADQKKFIGNSVEVTMAKKMAEAYGPYLVQRLQKAIVA